MGNIKKLKKKYDTPSHPWSKKRIEDEKVYLREYGLKNKKEIWKSVSILAKFKNLAKQYISSNNKQAEKESEQLLKKLRVIGLLNESSVLTDVLMLTDKDILERRLQTLVFRLGLSRSIKQARQFITHGHITVNGVKVTSPSYIVKKAEENLIAFSPTSMLSDPEHPERKITTATKKHPEKVNVKEEHSSNNNTENTSNQDTHKKETKRKVKSKTKKE